MALIQTSDLTGPALDWAVCEAEKLGGRRYLRDGKMYDPLCEEYLDYSTNWSLAGPIIEREWLDITPWPNESDEDYRWQCIQHDTPNLSMQSGPTPLIAAMRCFVASKLGAEIEVPDELLEAP